MPANLNALIRYKTIDRCLRNKYIRYDIKRLQEECSEALSESRGKSEKVSVRTIRDDIRVMRSEMLEFNAPIVCEEGYYRYSDPAYSIFNVSLNDKDVIRQVIAILLTHRTAINYPTLTEILETLGSMAGIDIPEMQPSLSETMAYHLPDKGLRYMIEGTDESKHSSESIKTSLSRKDQIQKSIKRKYVNREPDIMYSLGGPDESDNLCQDKMPAAFNWGKVLQVL